MKTKKKLFKVTLDWNDDAEDFSTYTGTRWAKDQAAAIRSVAAEMANDLECDGKERREYIAGRAAGAVVDDVACSVKSDIHDLLAGPGGTLTVEAKRAKRVIFDLLAAYGAPGCES